MQWNRKAVAPAERVSIPEVLIRDLALHLFGRGRSMEVVSELSSGEAAGGGVVSSGRRSQAAAMLPVCCLAALTCFSSPSSLLLSVYMSVLLCPSTAPMLCLSASLPLLPLSSSLSLSHRELRQSEVIRAI